jgi:RecJ-like exonuclease
MLDVSPFFSKDQLRPALCGIIYDGKWANATDAHIVIRWPHISETTTEKAPNIKKLFDDFVELDHFIFDKKEYRQWINTLPLVKEIIDCEECDGDGEVTWEYTSINGKGYAETHDCPVCDGKGGFDTGNLVPDGNNNYKTYGDVLFSQTNLNKLLLVMDYANMDTCYFTRSLNFHKGCIVKIDIYQIIITSIII